MFNAPEDLSTLEGNIAFLKKLKQWASNELIDAACAEVVGEDVPLKKPLKDAKENANEVGKSDLFNSYLIKSFEGAEEAGVNLKELREKICLGIDRLIGQMPQADAMLKKILPTENQRELELRLKHAAAGNVAGILGDGEALWQDIRQSLNNLHTQLKKVWRFSPYARGRDSDEISDVLSGFMQAADRMMGDREEARSDWQAKQAGVAAAARLAQGITCLEEAMDLIDVHEKNFPKGHYATLQQGLIRMQQTLKHDRGQSF